MHIHCRNVNDAFYVMVGSIHHGEFDPGIITEEDSRNGPVLMFNEPVTITYARPLERVLFDKARDANPFFHLFESIWMLAGSNDLAPLTYFLPRYADFSDDGKTVNGAYGYRWRFANQPLALTDEVCPEGYINHKFDQLNVLIDHLRAKPNSRRAVLSMWNVHDDLLQIDVSKDVCCLSWDTKFRSPEGDVDIQTLAKKFQTRVGFKFPVYAVDVTTGDQRICWMTNAWKTGNKPVLKIEFDDGSSIRMTGDHIVYRKRKLFDGKRCIGVTVEECKACDLQEGDSLLAELSAKSPCRTSSSSSRNKTRYRHFKKNIYQNTNHRNMAKEHREYLKFLGVKLKLKHSVHHKDGNGLNNQAANLEQLPDSIHYSMDKLGENNPHCKMSNAAKGARGKKHAISIRKTWASMSPELRSALITRKANRTPEQWQLVHEHNSAKSNHKIISIVRDGVTAVYDFTVPGRHNAILDNGVLVHNCNLCVCFSIRNQLGIVTDQGEWDRIEHKWLDMTVFNRSNDLIWGTLGANAVHFSYLQQYIADCLGIKVGVYNQVSNNLHVYTNNWKPEEWLRDKEHSHCYPKLPQLKLVTDQVQFDRECRHIVDLVAEGKEPTRVYKEPYINDVVVPMVLAFMCHKRRDYTAAINWMAKVASPDWDKAGTEWILRRYGAYKNKQEASNVN